MDTNEQKTPVTKGAAPNDTPEATTRRQAIIRMAAALGVGMSAGAAMTGCAGILRAMNYPDGGAVTEGRASSSGYSSWSYSSGRIYGSYSSYGYYSFSSYGSKGNWHSYYGSSNDPGYNRYYVSSD